jgi:hypothetical protein
VRRSRSHQPLRDRIMKFAGLTPYRCRDCHKRFFVNAPTDETLQRDRRQSKALAAHLAADTRD